MLSREELIDLANFDDMKLNNEEYAGKCSVISRGLPYYGQLKKIFPIHWISFSGMHKRKKVYNIDIDSLFKRDVNGFIEFILYIGDVPKYMISPSIGRIDHSNGYIIGNFRWESMSSNTRESGIRNIPNKDQSHLRLYNIEHRKIPSGIIKIIRNARSEKLKHLTETKFICDCIEWLKNNYNIIVSKKTIYSILKNEIYKDVI